MLSFFYSNRKSTSVFITAFLLIHYSAFSQPINEGFTNVANLFTSGWAQQNLSSPLGTNPTWAQGNTAVFPANSLPDTSYIVSNYNAVAGTGTISNWLFTPTRTFNNGDIVTFFTRSTGGNYPDNLQVRLSTSGAGVNVGTTSTSVGTYTTLLLEINPALAAGVYPSTWTQYTITISGLSGPTSGRVAFRYFVTNGGPTGANSDLIGIDNYVYTPVGSGSPEVSISQFNPGEYTLIPRTQLPASVPVSAVVTNSGTAAAATVTLNTRVFKLPNVATPVYNQTASTTNLATGASATINLPAFSPASPTLGDYIFLSIISGNTGSVVNDTFLYGTTVDPNWYARDNGTSTVAIGGGPTISCIIGNVFDVTANSVLDSVLFFCYPTAVGLNDTVRIRIASTTNGVPSNTAYVGFSVPYRFTVNDTAGAVITLPVTNLSGTALSLTPGKYFVGLEEYFTADNFGLQLADDIFTPNTVYANVNDGVYSTLSSLGFIGTPIIRAFFRSACAVTSTGSSTNATCSSANGTATVTPAGGAAPYTYAWSNGANTATATNLAAGTYTVTATDAASCSTTASVSVSSSNTAITSGTPTTTNSACGGATGSASVSPSNGTAPYLYNWNNGATTQTITNVAAGSYSVTITDGNGCSGTISNIVVSNPNSPIVNISSSQNVSCNGGNNGSATATASGGTAPFSYLWSNGTSLAGATNLPAGNYTVTVTDAASCAGVANVNITQPAALNAAATQTNVSCFGGSNGQAVAAVSGGSSPYTYLWSSGGSSNSVNGLAAGNYTLTVTDANGCTANLQVVVSQPTALTASATANDINCNGGANGSANGTANGGTSPYSWLWSNGSNSAVVSNLAAGSYTATVTDANGCSASTSTVTVSEPAALTANASATNVSAVGATDGAVDVTVSGGNSPYTFSWSNGSTTEDLSAVAAGNYTVTITDANGCTATQSAVVSEPTAIGSAAEDMQITMYPNPATKQTVLSVNTSLSGSLDIQITNVIGQRMLTMHGIPSDRTQITLQVADWAEGVYMVTVTNGNSTATYRLLKK